LSSPFFSSARAWSLERRASSCWAPARLRHYLTFLLLQRLLPTFSPCVLFFMDKDPPPRQQGLFPRCSRCVKFPCPVFQMPPPPPTRRQLAMGRPPFPSLTIFACQTKRKPLFFLLCLAPPPPLRNATPPKICLPTRVHFLTFLQGFLLPPRCPPPSCGCPSESPCSRMK